MLPMKPPEIDAWTSGLMAITAAAMTTSAPIRSDQGARLKNSHQMRIRAAPTTPTSTPLRSASGMKKGITYRTSTISATIATPGHKRSALSPTACRECSPAVVVIVLLLLMAQCAQGIGSRRPPRGNDGGGDDAAEGNRKRPRKRRCVGRAHAEQDATEQPGGAERRH